MLTYADVCGRMQASELVQRALAIDEKAFGPQHPQV
jgi:hypothetical protein